MKYILKKLTKTTVWKDIFIDRLTEPIHLNVLSLFILLFGPYRRKIDFDLIVRRHHAYGIMKCADYAKRSQIKTVSQVEFGVDSGAGILNIADIAEKVTKETGIKFNIYGFDTGEGLPEALDYRDHPDLYQYGDFPMNSEMLSKYLPENVKLIIGNVKDTVEKFINNININEPIGFVSFDLDYYHSTKNALRVFKAENPLKYMPITIIYIDDIDEEENNNYCGPLLGVNEFNCENDFRKIEHSRFLENARIFKRAQWIKKIYFLHVLDHPTRFKIKLREKKLYLEKP